MVNNSLSESDKESQEKSTFSKNAFKIYLSKGIKLTLSVKGTLKRKGCLYHPYWEGFVGPIDIKETIQSIFSTYKIKAELREIFNPWAWRSSAVNNLENQIEFLTTDLWKKDMRLIFDVERYDRTRSVWDFESEPERGVESTGKREDIKYVMEMDFHKRFHELEEIKEKLEGVRGSIELQKLEEQEKIGEVLESRRDTKIFYLEEE
jgi:hypothetical protein